MLEYKLTPFSSFLIFHIADMRVNNIATEFVNPDCVYSCYLYIPTDTEREQAVIVLNTSENNIESLKNIIMHIRSNEYDISSDMGDFDLNRLNSILTLCTNSLEKAPSPQIYMHKANFNSYKQNLTFKEYIIDYSKKTYRSIYEESLKDDISERIKNFPAPSLTSQEISEGSNLYDEMRELLSVFAAKDMTVLLGYYFYSMQYFEVDDEDHTRFDLCDYPPFSFKKPIALHISHSKIEDIIPIFKKLNKIFFNETLHPYTYSDTKSQKIDEIPGYPTCIICKSGIKQLCSEKWFKKHIQYNPTIVISSTSDEKISSKQVSHKITKIKSLAAVTKKHSYTALPEAISDFYKLLHIKTSTFSYHLESQKIKCSETEFIEKLFDEYLKDVSARTTYCEGKKGKRLAKLLFFVYSFLEFCLQKNLLTSEQANELNKKLFEFYFKDKIMWFENKSEENDDIPSEEVVADAIIKLLKDKYKLIPHHHPKDGTPCIFDANGSHMRLLFPSKNFLTDFAEWVKQNFPEEAPTIGLI